MNSANNIWLLLFIQMRLTIFECSKGAVLALNPMLELLSTVCGVKVSNLTAIHFTLHKDRHYTRGKDEPFSEVCDRTTKRKISIIFLKSVYILAKMKTKMYLFSILSMPNLMI